MDEIFFCLKMSIIQFLLKKNFSFFNKDREVLFDLLSNDKKVYIQNTISIEKNNDLSIGSCYPVDYKYICKSRMLDIVNCINECTNTFNAYLRFDDKNKISILCMKSKLNLISGQIINDEFWEYQIQIQINNMSNILNFLLYKFPSSPFFKGATNTNEFRIFMGKCLFDYTKAMEILEIEKEKKIIKNKKPIISKFSKKELEKEIDKELEKWSNGIKHEKRLNLLVENLKKFNI